MKFVMRLKPFLVFRFQSRLIVTSSSSCSKVKALNINNGENTLVSQAETKFSSLYVPGRVAGNIYQFVKPVIDVQYFEDNFDAIHESCRARGIELDCQNVLDTMKDWLCKKDEHEKWAAKSKEYAEEAERLKVLNFMKESDELQEKSLECIDRIKETKKYLYEIEDILMPLLQTVPNVLDKITPVTDSVKVYQEPFISNEKVPSHVEIGRNLSLLEFSSISPSAYYLKDSLAELEISLLEYFSEKLLKAQFAPISCIDFVKSFIVEATGLNPHSCDDCIPLKSGKSQKIIQNLNLVGGASFQSFCGYLVNMNTSSETLPAKYYSLGRHYEAGNRRSSNPSLFSVVQSSCIHSTVLSDPAQENSEFHAMLDVFLDCYIPLKIPFRTVDVAAAQLNHAESRRIRLEVWSPAQLNYIPIAYVSQRNDFVSKRLHITYGKEHTVNGYCSIVEGIVLNNPVLIGCMLENFYKGKDFVDFDSIHNLINLAN